MEIRSVTPPTEGLTQSSSPVTPPTANDVEDTISPVSTEKTKQLGKGNKVRATIKFDINVGWRGTKQRDFPGRYFSPSDRDLLREWAGEFRSGLSRIEAEKENDERKIQLPGGALKRRKPYPGVSEIGRKDAFQWFLSIQNKLLNKIDGTFAFQNRALVLARIASFSPAQITKNIKKEQFIEINWIDTKSLQRMEKHRSQNDTWKNTIRQSDEGPSYPYRVAMECHMISSGSTEKGTAEKGIDEEATKAILIMINVMENGTGSYFSIAQLNPGLYRIGGCTLTIVREIKKIESDQEGTRDKKETPNKKKTLQGGSSSSSSNSALPSSTKKRKTEPTTEILGVEYNPNLDEYNPLVQFNSQEGGLEEEIEGLNSIYSLDEYLNDLLQIPGDELFQQTHQHHQQQQHQQHQQHQPQHQEYQQNCQRQQHYQHEHQSTATNFTMEQLQPLPSHIENLLLPSTSHRKRARENDDIFNNGTGGNGQDVGDDDGVVAVSGSKNNQDGKSNGGDSDDGSGGSSEEKNVTNIERKNEKIMKNIVSSKAAYQTLKQPLLKPQNDLSELSVSTLSMTTTPSLQVPYFYAEATTFIVFVPLVNLIRSALLFRELKLFESTRILTLLIGCIAMLLVACRRVKCCGMTEKKVTRALSLYRVVCCFQLMCIPVYLILYPYVYDSCIQQPCYLKNATKSVNETLSYSECVAFKTLQHSHYHGTHYCHFSDCLVVRTLPFKTFYGFPMEENQDGFENVQKLCREHALLHSSVNNALFLRILYLSFHIYVLSQLLSQGGANILPRIQQYNKHMKDLKKNRTMAMAIVILFLATLGVPIFLHRLWCEESSCSNYLYLGK